MKNKKVLIILLITVFMFIPLINVNAATFVDCGNVTKIPKKVPEIISYIITIIQIAVPIVLVIFGSLDFFKGITSQKEDEIKKGQKMFIKRLVLAAIIFFVVAISKFIVSAVDKTNKSNIISCINCFLEKKCDNEREIKFE